MLKVMTIVGTRPELIKMSRVIAELDQHTRHVLVHTGQNFDYELNQVFFDDLGIRKPDYFLEAVGDNAAQTIARVIEKADAVMEVEQPDAIFVWLSDSPQLNEQSKQKFDLKADRIRLNQCIIIEDESFDKEMLEDGNIYFLNTQKLGVSGNLGKRSDTRQVPLSQRCGKG